MSNIATRARDVLLLTRYDALVATPPRDVSTPELLLEHETHILDRTLLTVRVADDRECRLVRSTEQRERAS